MNNHVSSRFGYDDIVFREFRLAGIDERSLSS